jgi:uncharacterized linocin/CFP29 family protein
MATNNLGRDKLDWSPDIWTPIDQAVHDEAKRTKVAAQFLPLYPTEMDMMTVQSDAVNAQTVPLLTVNEEAVTPLIEIWTEFALTKQQYEKEEHLMTAVTLAINAVNKLSRAEDLLLFQGSVGIEDDLFQSQTVNLRGASRDPKTEKIASRFTIVGSTGMICSIGADHSSRAY